MLVYWHCMHVMTENITMIRGNLIQLLFGTLAFTAFSAQAVVINFEGFAAGTEITNQIPGVTISATNAAASGNNLAVVFDTENPTGNDPDLGAPFNSNNPALADNFRPGKVLVIQENNVPSSNPNDEGSRPAGFFTLDFESLITLTSIDFFDVEPRPGEAGSPIQLFDNSGNEILAGAFITPDTGGDNMWDRVVFNVTGVKRIQINMGGSGAIDNIDYTVVPIPAAFWLFATGAAGLIASGKRKKTLSA